MRILAVPESPDLLGNRLFDPPVERNRDNCLEPFRYLREFLAGQGIQIDTVDLGDPAKADRIVFFELKRFTPLYESLEVTTAAQRILIPWEPPTVCPANYDRDLHALFGSVLTWNDDLVDGGKYVKSHVYVPRYPHREPLSFGERKLLVNITSNKASRHPDSLYPERTRAIRYFERRCPDQFDFFGMGWHRPTTTWQRLRLARVPRFPSYRGTVESKQKTLSRYRFALCYENMRSSNGYITEKIFDAMQAGTVPVYLGADNIADYVWPGTFIDRGSFRDHDELYAHLVSIGEDEHRGYLERIRAYLESDDFARFLPETFGAILLDVLRRPTAPALVSPDEETAGRRKVRARYLEEESRRAYADGRPRKFRKMFMELARLEPRRALGSPGLVLRYGVSLLGRGAMRRGSGGEAP